MDRGALAYRVHVSATPSLEPPVVLVHGIGMSHRYFRRLHKRLASDRTVVSVDLPGHGGLPKPGMDAGVLAISAGLADVLAELDLAPAVIFGHSMGAQWVVELAVRRPDLVAGVVIVGPVSDERFRTLPQQAVALTIDSMCEAPATNAIVMTDYVRCGVRWYATQARHMVGYAIEDRVALLSRPLLVLRGGIDPIAGTEWCRRLRDAAADGRMAVVPGRAHVVQHSAPSAVAAVVRAFSSALPTTT